VDQVTRELQALDLRAVSQLQQLQDVPGIIQTVRLATLVLFVLLIVASMGSAATIAHAAAIERGPEVAVMRTGGWSGSRIGVLFGAEASVVTGLAALVGAGLGTLLASTVGVTLREAVAGDALGDVQLAWMPTVGAVAAVTILVPGAYVLAVRRATRQPISRVFQEAR